MNEGKMKEEMQKIRTIPETIGKEISRLESEVTDWVSGKVSIKQVRLNSGFTLDVVSEATGISTKKLEWYEENPGDIAFDEAIMLCKLYGVTIDDVQFRADSVQDKGCRKVYPAARRLLWATEIKTKMSGIILSITDDINYSDRHIIDELLDILAEIENEENIIMHEISSGLKFVKSKNHLNLSLAGR
ncbi:helix-turn-helix domain-containing protein [Paenibacillus lautus]|uniref:helix-turn-helix domain-containing protein n=1 Tax=Paenibacillus lautus TaxID=1401 RepID=UPI003D269641